MATSPPPGPAPVATGWRFFKGPRFFFLIALLSVVIGCLAVSWVTRDAMANLRFLRGQGSSRSGAQVKKTIVDISPWLTAQALAPLAVSTEEVEYAREAERLADHDGDQAFAAALRQAGTRSHTLTGPALALSKKVAQLQQLVKEDQAHVQALTSGSSGGSQSTADDLQMTKAQLGLDSDELADAQQDLARASGDERAKIQEELAAHQAAMRTYDAQSQTGQVAVISVKRYGTLAQRFDAWLAQRKRQDLIQQAMQQAQADAATLTAQHEALEAAAETAASKHDPAEAAESTSDKISSIKTRSEQRQLLSIYDDRIQTQQQLANVYTQWSAQLTLQHRILLHLMLQTIALIAFVLMGVILCNAAVSRFFERRTTDPRRAETLSRILRLCVQFIGLIIVLLIIFGTPRQMPTILGLATAGLTVALQDFIISFLGWFVLMGRNGIRIGDSVEINGVGGEVTEIGLFRTVMLETGNWTDTGHPTGRRITFMNKFAISGQYFNFSTAGQWMWDEITLKIPSSADTYATIESLHQVVLKETDTEVHAAEQEWKRSPRLHGFSQLNATPSVNLRPSASGVEIVVRYVTRASSRFETRNRLYQRVIDLLHAPASQAPDAPTSQPA